MFTLLIEAEPPRDRLDACPARASMLRPELEQAPGLVDNSRYKSLTRDGWVLSLSTWRDEPSAAGWRARVRDQAQETGWTGILGDDRLRLGEVTWDTRDPRDRTMAPHRPTGSVPGPYLTLIDARQTRQWLAASNPQEIALYLGFDLYSYGDCISWDLFECASSAGEIILVVTWKDAQSAGDHAATQIVPDDARVRVVRLVRDEAVLDRGDMADEEERGQEAMPASQGPEE